jgi:glycosyltransferase involved in cell wall biosynthesis
MAGISFFIPAHNCAKTITESVDSIMETNFEDGDELIIVNDFSNDNTPEILKALKEKYPQIRLMAHTTNKGGAAARNRAVENSKHELLFCLDSDNVLEKDSVTILKKELINKKADIASFQEMRYFSSKNIHETNYIWRFLPHINLADFLADHKNPGSSGNYLFSKKSWVKAGGYPQFAGALDTWGFCFRQLATGSRLISLPETYYFHRYGTESYYITDMKRRNMSSVALQIILPFRHLINPEDLEYIMSDEHKLNWFENFDSRPIRIIGQQVGNKSIQINTGRHDSMKNQVRKIIINLKKLFLI